jgi:hypothetical protein
MGFFQHSDPPKEYDNNDGIATGARGGGEAMDPIGPHPNFRPFVLVFGHKLPERYALSPLNVVGAPVVCYDVSEYPLGFLGGHGPANRCTPPAPAALAPAAKALNIRVSANRKQLQGSPPAQKQPTLLGCTCSLSWDWRGQSWHGRTDSAPPPVHCGRRRRPTTTGRSQRRCYWTCHGTLLGRAANLAAAHRPSCGTLMPTFVACPLEE